MIGYKLTTRHYCSVLAKGKYKLKYPPGTTVHTLPDTIGILIFRTIEDVVLFRRHNRLYRSRTKLLLVEYDQLLCFDSPLQPMSCECSVRALDYYYSVRWVTRAHKPVPPGTLACPYVHVLKEVTDR